MTQPPAEQWLTTGQPPASPAGLPAAVPPPAADGMWKPERVEQVPGTEFGLVHLQIAPVFSGLATGSLVAGVASDLVALVVLCVGVAGAGALVAGAFAALATLAGGGAIALGLLARRQIRRSQEPGRIHFAGRGLAVAGLSCGAAGAAIALLSVVLALVVEGS